MRFVVVALALALLLAVSGALAQENQTNQSNQTNQTPSPSPASPNATPVPTPTPAPTTGRLKIITTPVDGDILIDRVVVGTGLYLNESYPAGSYRLEFGFVKGYIQPLPRVITVEGGKLNSFFGEYVPRSATYPKLTVVREVKPTDPAQGDPVNVILRIGNDGTATAVNVSVKDLLPDCVSNPSAETSWTGRLSPGEKRRIAYAVTASKPGLCIFESPNVTYADEDGTEYRASAEDVSISIAARAEAEPKLSVSKRAAEEKAIGENILVTIELLNVGNAPALKVRLNDTVPAECAQVVAGQPSFQGEVAPGDSRTITYEVELKRAGLCTFDASRVTYEGPGGKTYSAASKQLNVVVKSKAFAEILESWTKPVTVIAGAIGAIIFIYTLVHKAKTKAAGLKKKKE